MKKIIPLILICLAVNNLFAQDKHNVTKIVTVNSEDWKPIGDPAGYLSDTIKWDALTKDVFENGAVMVYILGTSGGGWYPLPHSYYGNGEMTIYFNYKEGYVELRSHSRKANGTNQNSKDSKLPAYKFKIVVL